MNSQLTMEHIQFGVHEAIVDTVLRDAHLIVVGGNCNQPSIRELDPILKLAKNTSLVYPRGASLGNVTQGVESAKRDIDDIVGKIPDSIRIDLVGVSLGGIAVISAAVENPDRFRVAISIAGPYKNITLPYGLEMNPWLKIMSSCLGLDSDAQISILSQKIRRSLEQSAVIPNLMFIGSSEDEFVPPSSALPAFSCIPNKNYLLLTHNRKEFDGLDHVTQVVTEGSLAHEELCTNPDLVRLIRHIIDGRSI